MLKPLLLLVATMSHLLAAELPFFIASAGTEKDAPGIYAASLDSVTGAIAPPTLASEQRGTSFLQLNTAGDRLLSTCSLPIENRQNGGMAIYDVSKDGSLKKLSEISSLGRGACHVSLDQTGQVAMVANYGSGSVASARINPDGQMTFGSHFANKSSGSKAHKQRQNAAHAHSIYPGPRNKYAYAADLGTDSVFVYKMETASGELALLQEAKTPAGAGPRHLKFSKEGSHAFVLNELNTTVSVFQIDANGTLKREQDISVFGADYDNDGITCSEIIVHPSGKYLYTANRDVKKQGRDSLSLFTIAPDSTLQLVETVPAIISIPRNITLSPAGDWLLVCGQASNAIVAFKVDAGSGKLGPISELIGCPRPMCIVFR